MRCEEIQERYIDLLYSERGTPSASPELEAHIASCPSCRKELEDLRNIREKLRLWEDEPPLRSVSLPARERSFHSGSVLFRHTVRYAAIAAMLLVAFLVLANAEITWNKEGFAYKNNLFSRGPSQSDYYTKAEVREILKRVTDDSESRMGETNYLMMQELLDTVEKDQMMDLRFVQRTSAQSRARN